MGNKNIKRRNKIFIAKQKQDSQCNKCGWMEHPEILQYHHYYGEKLFEINALRYKGSIKQIKIEMEKCLLLCPNCHAWIHWQEYRVEPIPLNPTGIHLK